MMNESMESIPWHKTLAFKLFLLVSSILFAAIAAISVQNSRQFRAILKQQNDDHLQVTALATASSFQNNLDYWSSLANSLGHMSATLPGEQLQVAAKGLLAANQGLAAIQIITTLEGNTQIQNIVLTTGYDSPDTVGKKIQDFEKKISEQGREFLRASQKKGIIQRVFLNNLTKNTQMPLVQLATRLTRQINRDPNQKQKDEVWVILSIWQSTMASAFQTSKLFSSALVDPLGNYVLQTNRDNSVSATYADVHERDLLPLTGDSIRSRTWLTKNQSGHPVMVSANWIAEINMFIVAQKIAKQDNDAISRQTRNTLLSSWILFLIALAVCYVAASGITNRIMQLVRSTWEIAAGNLGIQLSEYKNDEVGILSRSVNKMASDIQNLLRVREVAIRQQTELKMAENIQRMLVPKKHTHQNGIITRSYFKPATECAGDWWGRFTLGEGKELVVLADATGHGAHAAIIASIAYSYFSTVTSQIKNGETTDLTAVKMVHDLNAVLYGAGQGQSTMTIFLLLFDTIRNTVEAVSAGHCPAFSMSDDKSNIVACHGGVLGAEKTILTEPKTLDLKLGQRFLLYTDGLFECSNENGDKIKKKRINERLASWNMLPFDWLSKKIIDIVEGHFNGTPLTDDITLVLIEYCGTEPQPLQHAEQITKKVTEENIDPIDHVSNTWVQL